MPLHKVLTYHLAYVMKRYAEEFVGIQETHELFERLQETYPELIKEAQRVLPIHQTSEVLQRLVGEDVSIRNLRLILESLVEWGQQEKDVVMLTEYVRSDLKRYISYKYSNDQNVLSAYLLDQDAEETIRGGIRQTSSGNYLALDPPVTERLVAETRALVGDIGQAGDQTGDRHRDGYPSLPAQDDRNRVLRPCRALVSGTDAGSDRAAPRQDIPCSRNHG